MSSPFEKRARVLIVDDNELWQKSSENIVQQRGNEVVSRKSRVEALAALENPEQLFSLIICESLANSWQTVEAAANYLQIPFVLATNDAIALREAEMQRTKYVQKNHEFDLKLAQALQ